MEREPRRNEGRVCTRCFLNIEPEDRLFHEQYCRPDDDNNESNQERNRIQSNNEQLNGPFPNRRQYKNINDIMREVKSEGFGNKNYFEFLRKNPLNKGLEERRKKKEEGVARIDHQPFQRQKNQREPVHQGSFQTDGRNEVCIE